MKKYKKYSDENIIDLLKNNKVQVINILYDLHYHTMVRIAFRVINDNEAAKDVVQELFLNVWVKRHQLSIKKPIASYLARSVINRCLNYLRDSPSTHSILSVQIKETDKNKGEELLEYNDLKRLVQLSINSLPPKCRLIFNLSRSEEMSHEEIASYLGISRKAIEKQITKALKHLRRDLKPYLSAFFCFVMV